jgi:hypothetical protein
VLAGLVALSTSVGKLRTTDGASATMTLLTGIKFMLLGAIAVGTSFLLVETWSIGRVLGLVGGSICFTAGSVFAFTATLALWRPATGHRETRAVRE